MPPVSTSYKRKLDELEEEESGSQLDQRKSILDISMTKLRFYNPRRKVEPSLRRSVLIFNTLKNIENQLKLEGVCVTPACGQPNLGPDIHSQNSDDVIDAIPGSKPIAPPLLPQSQLHHNVSSQPQMLQQYENMDYSLNYPRASNISSTSLCNSYLNNSNNLLNSNLSSETAQLGAVPYVNSSPSSMDTSYHIKSNNNSVSSLSDQCTITQYCAKTDPSGSSGSACHQNVVDSTVTTAKNSMNSSEQTLSSNQKLMDDCHQHSSITNVSSKTTSWEGSSFSSSSPTGTSTNFTESLLSDTSKFILDSLLSSDKLITVASFSSLFEFDNNSENEATSSCASNITCCHHQSANQNNNCSSAICTTNSSGCQIPPFSSLGCTFNNHPPTWTSSAQSNSNIVVGNANNTTSVQAQHNLTDGWYSGSSYNSSSSNSVRNCSQHYQNLDSNTSHWGENYNSGSNNGYSLGFQVPQQNVPHLSSSITCRQESESPNILGDIDCNTFDFDLFLPSLSPSMKLTQLNHEDLVHTLPSADVSAFSSSHCSTPTTPVPTLCSPKNELLGDDLDHIMQILVGI